MEGLEGPQHPTLLGMKSQLETEPGSPRSGWLSERAGSVPVDL